MSLLFVFLTAIGLNLAMFVPAYIFKTDKLTDISYAATFALLSLVGFSQSTQTPAHLLVLACVLAWSVRLGTFLFIRINRTGHDSRFDGMREHFFSFLRFWILQGATVFVVLIAAALLWQNPTASLASWWPAGFAVFAIGLLLEATADAQKYRFSNNPKNKGKWIASGVWSISRHPNYLGEMMVWIGLYLVIMPALTGTNQLIALLSPAYICLLLLFVSGIPLLEKSADAKWGKLAAYQQYKRDTPVLIPWLRR